MPYYYTLPLLTEMTISQQSVLDQPNAVAITGGPGTGKSVVSVWRHLRNHSIDKQNSLLLTYTKTLQYVLASAAVDQNRIASRHVQRTYEWIEKITDFRLRKYDEIIIDEAQDVSMEKYEVLKKISDRISYGADDQQILYPEQATNLEKLQELFPKNSSYELDQNHRNTYEIMRFVRATLTNMLITQNIMDQLKIERSFGIKPKCVITSNTRSELNIIKGIIEEFGSDTHNIGILLPLKEDVQSMYELISAEGITCSKYYSNDEEIEVIENIHITTFKSSKGIEFDTVIIPGFGNWRNNIKSLFVVKEKDYYVALTRAKRNLYLLSSKPLDGVNSDTYDII